MLRRFNRDEYGASAVEYVVALILCCMVVLGINKLFGETLRAKFAASQNEISEMDAPDKAGEKNAGRKLGARAAAGGTSPRTGDDAMGSGSGSGSRSGASGAAGSGGGGGKGDDKGGVKRVTDRGDQTRSEDDPGGYVEGFDEEKKAGFNPLFLLIFLALGGLLMFIMYKGNKG
jgi:Flp pilus assembly pilin Flp